MRSIEWRNWPPLLTPMAKEAKVTPHACRSHASWNTGSPGSTSTGPNPSMPPRSWMPSTHASLRGGGCCRFDGGQHAQGVLAEDATHVGLGHAVGQQRMGDRADVHLAPVTRHGSWHAVHVGADAQMFGSDEPAQVAHVTEERVHVAHAPAVVKVRPQAD